MTDGGGAGAQEAKAYFRRDVSRSWAAYIAGCVLVLAREKGLAEELLSDSLSILVHSQVYGRGRGALCAGFLYDRTLLGICVSPAARSVSHPRRTCAGRRMQP